MADFCVASLRRDDSGQWTITVAGGDAAVLDEKTGMTLNDLAVLGLSAAILELSDPPAEVGVTTAGQK